MGASPSKIVLGLPFYGRTFISQGKGNFDDISDDNGFQGPYTKENGFMGYNEICASIENDTWTVTWDAKTAQAIARQSVAGEKTRVIVYDTSRSIANKVRFAVRQELGGVMIWSVDTDDFLGSCPLDNDETFADFKNIEMQQSFYKILKTRNSDNYPLLRTINEAIAISEEEWNNDRDRENEIDSNSVNVAYTFTISMFILLLVPTLLGTY